MLGGGPGGCGTAFDDVSRPVTGFHGILSSGYCTSNGQNRRTPADIESSTTCAGSSGVVLARFGTHDLEITAQNLSARSEWRPNNCSRWLNSSQRFRRGEETLSRKSEMIGKKFQFSAATTVEAVTMLTQRVARVETWCCAAGVGSASPLQPSDNCETAPVSSRETTTAPTTTRVWAHMIGSFYHRLHHYCCHDIHSMDLLQTGHHGLSPWRQLLPSCCRIRLVTADAIL
jgi:hypothetical protein